MRYRTLPAPRRHQRPGTAIFSYTGPLTRVLHHFAYAARIPLRTRGRFSHLPALCRVYYSIMNTPQRRLRISTSVFLLSAHAAGSITAKNSLREERAACSAIFLLICIFLIVKVYNAMLYYTTIFFIWKSLFCAQDSPDST